MINIKNIKKKKDNQQINLNSNQFLDLKNNNFTKFKLTDNFYFKELPFARQWLISFEDVNLKEFDKYVSRVVSPSLIQVYPSRYAIDSIFFRIVALGGLMFYVVVAICLDISNEIDQEIFNKFYFLILLILYVGFVFTIFHILKGIFLILKNFYLNLLNIFKTNFNLFNKFSINIKFNFFYKILFIFFFIIIFFLIVRLAIMFNSYIEIVDYLDSVNESVWSRYQSIERPIRYNISLDKDFNYPNLKPILKDLLEKSEIKESDYDSRRFNEINLLFYNKGTFLCDYPGNYMHILSNPGQKEGYWAFRGYHNEIFNVDRVHFVRHELKILSDKLKIFLSIIPIILIEKDISSSLFYLKLTWNSLIAPDVYKYFAEPFMGNYFNLFKNQGLPYRSEDPLKFLRYDVTRLNSIAAANGEKNMVYNTTSRIFWKRLMIDSLGFDFIRDIELNFHLRDKLQELNYFFMPSFLNEILYHKNFFFGLIHLYSDRFIQNLQNLQNIQEYSKLMLDYFDRTFIHHISGNPLVAQYWFNGFLLQPEDPHLLRLPLRDPMGINKLFTNLPEDIRDKSVKESKIKPELNFTMFLLEPKEMLNPRNYPRQDYIMWSKKPPVYVRFSELIMGVPSEFFDLGNRFDISANSNAFKLGERHYFKSIEFTAKNIVVESRRKLKNMINFMPEKLSIILNSSLSWESDTLLTHYLRQHTIVTGGGPHFWDMPQFESGLIQDEFFPNPNITKYHKIRSYEPYPERDFRYKFLINSGLTDYNAHKAQLCYNPGTLIRWSHYFKTLYNMAKDAFDYGEKKVPNLNKYMQQVKYNVLMNNKNITEEQYDEHLKSKHGIKNIKYWNRKDPMLYDQLNFPDWLRRDWREIQMIFKFAKAYNPFSREELYAAYLIGHKKDILINQIAPYLNSKYYLDQQMLKNFFLIGFHPWLEWVSSEDENIVDLVLTDSKEYYPSKYYNTYFAYDNTDNELVPVWNEYYHQYLFPCPYPNNYRTRQNYRFWHFDILIDDKNFECNLYNWMYNEKIKLKNNHKLIRHLFIMAENLTEFCVPPQEDDYILSAEDRALIFLNSKKLKHFIISSDNENFDFFSEKKKYKLIDRPLVNEYVDRLNVIKKYSNLINKNLINNNTLVA